jgi:hypothetical protein
MDALSSALCARATAKRLRLKRGEDAEILQGPFFFFKFVLDRCEERLFPFETIFFLRFEGFASRTSAIAREGDREAARGFSPREARIIST